MARTVSSVSHWNVFVFILLQVALAQDTHLPNMKDRHHKQSDDYNNKWPSSAAAAAVENSLKKAEERMNLRLHEAERRILHKVHQKLRVQNQSLTIFHLERLVHHVNEEMELVKEEDERDRQRVRHLKQQVTKQQSEIHRLRKGVDSLKRDVRNLTHLVERLLAEGGPPRPTRPDVGGGGEVTTQKPRSPTQPVDFNPMYPVGEYLLISC